MATGFKMVRIPDELAERITAKGHKREPFVREAVEAALAEPEARGIAPSRNDRPASATSPAPPRAPVTHIGCERHPEAGAYQGPNGRWWCANRSCIKAARRQAA